MPVILSKNGGLSKHRCALQLTALCSTLCPNPASSNPGLFPPDIIWFLNPGKQSLIRFLYWLCRSCEGQPFTWLVQRDLQKKSNADGHLISLHLDHFHILMSLDIFCICSVEKSNKPLRNVHHAVGSKASAQLKCCCRRTITALNSFLQPHL